MNDNFKDIEHVSAVTEESSASTHILVDMVNSIKNMSDKLEVVIKE